jgi:geranylgeranyl reductase family protein
MSISKSDTFDVIVIGSGVAGSSAAYDLAKTGLKVFVIEKEKLPRYKTCGGGVVSRAANLLPFEISSVVQKVVSSADVYDQENNLKFQIKTDSAMISFVMRADLDNHILSKALEKGAMIFNNTEVKGIDIKAGNVSIETGSKTFTANYVIAADGATGFSMTYFKLYHNVIRVPAVESEMIVDEETYNKFNKTARFDFGFVPHGYGWVFPKKDHLSVGVAFMKKTNQSIQNWFKKYLELLEINAVNILKNEKHGYVIPLIKGKPNCSNGRILFAGDNLGLADPLTAEGIRYAVETGRLAASSIIKYFNSHNDVVKNYSESIERVHKEIKSAKFLAKLVYGPLWLRKFIFRRWGRRLSELLADVITEKKKYSELVRDPMNYLRLFRPKYFLNNKR